MEQIHGHQVMQMIVKEGLSHTRASLVSKIEETFGSATRFRTCSAEGMTAEEMVMLFEQKGKFSSEDYKMDPAAGHQCGHH